MGTLWRFSGLLGMVMAAVAMIGCKPSSPAGSWMLDGEREAIVFHDDGTFEALVSRNEPDSLRMRKIWLVYSGDVHRVDFKRNPVWIDFMVSRKGGLRG